MQRENISVNQLGSSIQIVCLPYIITILDTTSIGDQPPRETKIKRPHETQDQ